MSEILIEHVFALARELSGFRGVWDYENNWEIDQVPCMDGDDSDYPDCVGSTSGRVLGVWGW